MLKRTHFLHIEGGTIAQVCTLAPKIPEFSDPVYEEKLIQRLKDVPSLILIAYWDSQPAGFKIGYERHKDGSFYSWIGAVLKDHRKKGIARALAEKQEAWAGEQGYTHIRFKTRNCFKAMQCFALKRGFDIIGYEAREDRSQDRIWMEKKLYGIDEMR